MAWREALMGFGKIHRESLAVLLLFQRACEEVRLTAELARQLASLLRKGRCR